MSILRISCLPDGFYAPDRVGNITVTGSYSRRSRKGKMEYISPSSKLLAPIVKSKSALAHYVHAVLEAEGGNLPKEASAQAPISIFVHGFQFDPTTQVFDKPHHPEGDNPHGRLYHWKRFPEQTEIRAHSTSWPLGFGYVENDQGKHGICVGFGWYSSPDFLGSLFNYGKNFYARAYDLAEEAALHLIAAIEVLATQLPSHPINLICHSLGSRVVIRAIAKMAKDPSIDDPDPSQSDLREPEPEYRPRRPDLVQRLNKIVLLAGAEKVMEAQLMMGRLNSFTGSSVGPYFYNFVSRENDVLDKLGENFSPDAPGSKQVIGHNGLEMIDPRWIDIQLDDPDTADYFAHHGKVFDPRTNTEVPMRLNGDRKGVFAIADHWIHYTWRHNMVLYRQIIREE
ncbi:MAG: alpha/beta hydrolase, partial [Proteobacteria bacterium]|nr:alpha/beta hydrolase [Pseudomonadota bacterium]